MSTSLDGEGGTSGATDAFPIAESVIDTSSPHGKLLMQIFGRISEFERLLISERTNEGMVRAKALGWMGKPPNLSLQQQRTLHKLREQSYS